MCASFGREKTTGMSTEIEVHLRPLAPSASLDRLDLTLTQARALSPETFVRRLHAGLARHVRVVGVGCFRRGPCGCDWWLSSTHAFVMAQGLARQFSRKQT